MNISLHGVSLKELHLFIPPSVVLTVFQNDSIIKQLKLKGCVFQSVFIWPSSNFVWLLNIRLDYMLMLFFIWACINNENFQCCFLPLRNCLRKICQTLPDDNSIELLHFYVCFQAWLNFKVTVTLERVNWKDFFWFLLLHHPSSKVLCILCTFFVAVNVMQNKGQECCILRFSGEQ